MTEMEFFSFVLTFCVEISAGRSASTRMTAERWERHYDAEHRNEALSYSQPRGESGKSDAEERGFDTAIAYSATSQRQVVE